MPRAFRTPVSEVPETEVRGRGESLVDRLPLRSDERLALVFPDTPLDGGSFAVIVSERGQVRRIGKQYLGPNLQAGTVLYDVRDGGAPAAICWSSGNQDLFIITQSGQGIRFAERLVPVRGCLGLPRRPFRSGGGCCVYFSDWGHLLAVRGGKRDRPPNERFRSQQGTGRWR